MTEARALPRMLHLHDTDGRQVSLCASFIIAAMGHGNGREYTQITMDGLGRNIIITVREPLSAITGPFADIKWLKFNPAYFIGIEPNKNSEAKTWPNSLVFRAPQALSFVTSSSAEDVEKAIIDAFLNSPRLPDPAP